MNELQHDHQQGCRNHTFLTTHSKSEDWLLAWPSNLQQSLVDSAFRQTPVVHLLCPTAEAEVVNILRLTGLQCLRRRHG
jgi:hypothetical protein